MRAKNDSPHVLRLPREPFLAHSEVLLNSFLKDFPEPCKRILELGCGPQSPLLPMLQRKWGEIHVHQIDALADVVAEAAKFNPGGIVEQMLTSDMAAIPSRSKDMVVAMSVFDQNPSSIAPKVASEIYRVLGDSGRLVYIHNEELNLPATADSFLNRPEGAKLLLPSDSWNPTNDFEYCSGNRADIETAAKGFQQELGPLVWYLRGIYPQLYGERVNHDAVGKVSVPFLRECTAPVMGQIRKSVEFLRSVTKVALIDHRTADLVGDLIERQLFSPEHGFQIIQSGVFEIRQMTHWKNQFNEQPPVQHFVRGLSRFGYTSESEPEPRADFDQSLNRPKSKSVDPKSDDDVLLVSYQYGCVAHKN